MNTETTNATETVHPFERAGMGKAPFRYIGMEVQTLTASGTRDMGEKDGVRWETTPGGTCDACGKAIMDIYRVRSADGKVSTVGCDCIKKVGAVADVKRFEKDCKAIQKTKRQAAKVKSDAKADARIQAAIANLDRATKLTEIVHPTAWGMKAGLTMADYVRWMFENAGRTGRLNAAKMVENALKAS